VVVTHLMEQKIQFVLVSHSESGSNTARMVPTETVFGNAMCVLKDCVCVLPTTPANNVPADRNIDGFFVVGGQCPYHMMEDAAVTKIMDAASLCAAICHGPEALIGSKWLGADCGPFTSYHGCWMSFRHVLASYEKKPVGTVVENAAGNMITANSPVATSEFVVRSCGRLRAMRAGR